MMVPRVVFIFCLVILSVFSIHFRDNAAATQTGYFGYCATTPGQSPVYFSQVFNTGLDLNFTPDSTAIQNEFNEYLKGRFDAPINSNYGVGCPIFNNAGQAQSVRRDYESQLRQRNDQIIEVEWNYRPEPPHGPPPIRRPGTARPPAPAPQPDHTFCISDTDRNTVYFTGPIATPSSVAMYNWINGFTQFLKTNYSFQGRVYCNMSTTESGRRLVNAHVDGSRAAGHSVVDTDWKYDETQAATTPASRPDEDREPAQRPAAQPPNLQARDFVSKERPSALSHCVSDRLMGAAFECQCLVRQIAAYRMAHTSDTLSPSPTPLDDLFTGDRVDFKSCVLPDWKFKFSVRSAVRSQGASEANAGCATDKFRALLTAKPYPSRTKEILNEAINSCR